MSNCQNLCTAEKCRELEQKIFSLEEELLFIKDTLKNHLNQDIPEAHKYYSNLELTADLVGEFLLLGVSDVTGAYSFKTVDLSPFLTQSVLVDVFDTGDNNFNIQVRVDGILGQDNFQIVIPEPEPLEPPSVLVDVFDTGDNTFNIQVRVDGILGQDNFQIVIPEPEPIDLRLDVFPLDNNEFDIKVFANDREAGDRFKIETSENEVTEIINNYYSGGGEVSCDLSGVLDRIENVIAIADSNSYLIELRTGQLESKLEEILLELTQDISGTINSDYAYIFEADVEGNPKPTYPSITKAPRSYSGQGLRGIKEVIELLAKNQDVLFDASSKGISPLIELDLSKDIENICTPDQVNEGNYADRNDFIDVVTDILIDRFADSAAKFLVKALKLKNLGLKTTGGVAGFIISTTLDWGISYLLEKNSVQEKSALAQICDAIKDIEVGDVVAIVASDKVTENVKEKQLVLHFVDFDNYPKRSSDSNYRPIQIPQPKSQYNWCDDFENLRWETGNFYASLYLKFEDDTKWKTPITGYFGNQSSADAYFNSVLTLTTLQEDYRAYHPTTKSRSFSIKETRPYRAFIVLVNEAGEGICETKYVPPVGEDACA